ncbi:hypothetical protein C6Y14_00600 [Streptomyces dioscori]|uniref:Uncharacterized protein n=1 Tax=Streptomyces dioscori TaxID=2109333 RepID=A0A2P8QEK3_9ACTN|nr:hypothetical protein [Streptomyces dioscori]PSM44681.1 hypothetical protein C6Y14_00600 [Streptomyces dioscori]
MSEQGWDRALWKDAGVLDGAISGPPRSFVTGGGTRLRVEYRVTGEGVAELNYTPTGQEGEEEVGVDEPRLPWSMEVFMPGPIAIPVLGVTLGEDGGRAELVVLVDGRESARVTVTGRSAIGICVADPFP